MIVNIAYPKSLHDPSGSKTITTKAQRDFERRIKAAFKEIIDTVFLTLKPEVIELNESQAYIYGNERVYRYMLDPSVLTNLNIIIADILNRFLMVDENGNYVSEFNPDNLWFFRGYVQPEYERGTRQAMSELSQQSVVYQATHQTLADILYSEPYTRRIGYITARQFELMKGFTDETVKAVRTILSDTIAAGESPREAAKKLRERVTLKTENGTDRFDLARANRICQTEIPRALRRAKEDEMEQAQIDYGIKSMIMPISAFKKTSRKTHMARSGTLVTLKQQREFYSLAKESVNCFCSEIIVVVDNFGKPLSQGLVDKAVAMRQKFYG